MQLLLTLAIATAAPIAATPAPAPAPADASLNCVEMTYVVGGEPTITRVCTQLPETIDKKNPRKAR